MATLRPAEMTAPAGTRARRRLIPIVDAAFQWKYTLFIVALGVGTACVLGGLLYHAHQANTRLLDLGGDARLQEQVARADQWFLYYLLGSIVLMAFSLGLGGLVVTHRISGPAYLVARYCNVLAHGHYPDVRPLRKHDELQQFFGAFCGAIHSMRDRDLHNLRHLELAEAKAKAALLATDSAQWRQGLESALAALEEQRHAVAKMLGTGEGVEVGTHPTDGG